MWLSELYGRIGQILAEHGDMPVTRPVDPHYDGLSSIGPFYFELPSETFTYEDSVVTNGEKTVGRTKRFIVHQLTRK